VFTNAQVHEALGRSAGHNGAGYHMGRGRASRHEKKISKCMLISNLKSNFHAGKNFMYKGKISLAQSKPSY
jgi:hypothetical protein